jgi:pantetheine-phosphate adenylyltransferase
VKKRAIYAGSFDPWTLGHQFVLNSALEVFDDVHVVSAVNPSKYSIFKPDVRARVIAHAVDPFCDWWSQDPPFHIGNRVTVMSQEGLVADYAQQHGISHLIRGLRSTTDFEAEFNLYFSNQAINPALQTWAIMCPPRLLHCSSTYVKTVVGKPHVKFVGANFASQCLMLSWPILVGRLFDLIESCSRHRFDVDPFNLNGEDLAECLQFLFSSLYSSSFAFKRSCLVLGAKRLDDFLNRRGAALREAVQQNAEYPEHDINHLWGILACCLGQSNGVNYLFSLAGNLGKTTTKLFYEQDVQVCYQELARGHK